MKMNKIAVTILSFEQISHEDFKTIPKTKVFERSTSIEEIEQWIKTINKHYNITHAYIAKL